MSRLFQNRMVLASRTPGRQLLEFAHCLPVSVKVKRPWRDFLSFLFSKLISNFNRSGSQKHKIRREKSSCDVKNASPLYRRVPKPTSFSTYLSIQNICGKMKHSKPLDRLSSDGRTPAVVSPAVIRFGHISCEFKIVRYKKDINKI